MCKISLFLLVVCTLLSIFTAVHGSEAEVKAEELLELTKKSSVIHLNGDSYRKYVKNALKNYAVIVMLTSLDSRRGCRICSMALEEFEALAESHRKQYPEDKSLFFALADYDAVAQIFTDLNINTAPYFTHFPASGLRSVTDEFDIQRYGFTAEVLAKWVRTQTSVSIRIIRPPNYTGTLILAIFMGLGGSLLYFKWNSFTFLFNRSFWATLSMVIIFYMISGQVWNHIRGPQVFQIGNRGEVTLIYPSSDYQFVAETFIVMSLYIVISMSFIIIYSMNSITDPNKRRTMAILGLVMFVGGLSLLIHVFRKKYQGYPYSFLLR